MEGGFTAATLEQQGQLLPLHVPIFHGDPGLRNRLPNREEFLVELLSRGTLEQSLIAASVQALKTSGLSAALGNFRQQSKNVAQFESQVHRWFDGFRTLKFLHALRDSGWPLLTLAATFATEPMLWPQETGSELSVADLRSRVYSHFEWEGTFSE